MAPKDCFLGVVRRRTIICCRNVKISASIAARDRNRSTIAQTMSLTRSLITDQHRPILGQPLAIRFATGTGISARFSWRSAIRAQPPEHDFGQKRGDRRADLAEAAGSAPDRNAV